MAGVKGRGGQPGRSGKHSSPRTGRTPKSVKALAPLYDAIKAASARYNPPGQPVADIHGLTYCPGCGRWGWEEVRITVWGEDWGVVEGATPLGAEVVAGKLIRHSENCRFK
jgi:hypothetical protein